MSIKFTELPLLSTITGTEIFAVTDISGTPESKQTSTDALASYIQAGNSATATKLASPVYINGIGFDGSASINITVSGDVLTGNTLAATIVNSSLTNVGTLAALTVSTPINADLAGNANTVTTNANLNGVITSVGNTTSITSQSGTGTTFITSTDPIFNSSIDGTTTFQAFGSVLTLTLGNVGSLASTTNISTGPVAALATKTINIGTGGGAFSTTNVNIGSANGGKITFASQAVYKIFATSTTAPTISSGPTIAPTAPITFISGTQVINTITPHPLIALSGGQITLIPLGVFFTNTAGNIALGTTAVVNKALIMTYDSSTQKWYPSY
jgi:hypothetical protein